MYFSEIISSDEHTWRRLRISNSRHCQVITVS